MILPRRQLTFVNVLNPIRRRLLSGKTGRLRRPDEPAWPEHTRRREQSRCPEVHTFDSRASSIDEFFRKANAVDISDFLHERPQYMSSWNAIREMGEAESAKQGGKPQEMRPPEQLIGAPG